MAVGVGIRKRNFRITSATTTALTEDPGASDRILVYWCTIVTETAGGAGANVVIRSGTTGSILTVVDTTAVGNGRELVFSVRTKGSRNLAWPGDLDEVLNAITTGTAEVVINIAYEEHGVK